MQGGRRIHRQEFSFALASFGEVQINGTKVWIEICADGKAQDVFRLLQRVFGLNDLHPACCHLGLGAVDIQRRQGAEFQRALVALVTCLSRVLRLSRDF